MLTFRQLQAFKAVIDAGSVVRAADVIGLSQPAVSRLLSDLESAVGYRLFDRRRGRLTPLDEAKDLYREVDRSFIGLGRIKESAERIGRGRTSHLRIAMLPALASGPLIQVVAEFLDRNPDVFLSLETRTRLQMLEGIAHDRHDVGLVTLPVDDPDLGVRPVVRADWVCIVPEDHPLSRLEVISPQDLDGVSFIASADRSPMRLKLDRVFSDVGVRPDIRVEATTAQAAIALAAQGVGVTLSWRGILESMIMRGIRAIPFRPQLDVQVVAVYPASRPPTGAAADLLDAFEAAARAQLSMEV